MFLGTIAKVLRIMPAKFSSCTRLGFRAFMMKSEEVQENVLKANNTFQNIVLFIFLSKLLVDFAFRF